jgi:hypothetical protein
MPGRCYLKLINEMRHNLFQKIDERCCCEIARHI